MSTQLSISNLKTKPFKDLDKQIELLQTNRHLIIKDVKFAKKKLLEINYFDLINGFETLLLVDKNNKSLGYENKRFDDFISLHTFDKELSKEILAVISSFESKLKTSLAYNFCKICCDVPEKTLAYLSKNNYEDPANSYGKNHPAYKDYYKNWFVLFQKPYNYDRNYVEYLKKTKSYIGKDTDPPLWIIIKSFSMGDLLSMVRLLKRPVLERVLADFNLTLNDTHLFINSIEIIKDLRNTCAHFELVNRFRTSGAYVINNNLITRLQLNVLSHGTSKPQSKRNNYRIRLFDSLKVLTLFEDITPIRRVVVRYYDRNVSIRQKYLILPLLDRMGDPNINNWKNLGYHS